MALQSRLYERLSYSQIKRTLSSDGLLGAPDEGNIREAYKEAEELRETGMIGKIASKILDHEDT
jgi:hypothetical protein